MRSRQVETRGQNLDLAGPGFWCPPPQCGLGQVALSHLLLCEMKKSPRGVEPSARNLAHRRCSPRVGAGWLEHVEPGPGFRFPRDAGIRRPG